MARVEQPEDSSSELQSQIDAAKYTTFCITLELIHHSNIIQCSRDQAEFQ